MKEFIAILAELEKSNRQGKTTILATVIEAQGSTYRRAGARMLLTSAFNVATKRQCHYLFVKFCSSSKHS